MFASTSSNLVIQEVVNKCLDAMTSGESKPGVLFIYKGKLPEQFPDEDPIELSTTIRRHVQIQTRWKTVAMANEGRRLFLIQPRGGNDEERPDPKRYHKQKKHRTQCARSLKQIAPRAPTTPTVSAAARSTIAVEPRTIIGEGRVDPFARFPPSETNPFIRELIDHGRFFILLDPYRNLPPH